MFDFSTWLQSSAMPTVVGGVLVISVGYGSLHAQVEDLKEYQSQQFTQIQTSISQLQNEIINEHK